MTADECTKAAEEARRMAARSPEHRDAFLKIAEQWEALAKEAWRRKASA